MSQAVLSPPSALQYVPYHWGMADESRTILERWIDVREHYWRVPITRQSLSSAQRFQYLSAQWRRERGPTSSVTQMAMQPAYQQIIGMGANAIPLILSELERKPDHWFWALKAISGADPVRPEQRGNIRQMAAAWVRWGREQGYRW